MRRWGKGIVAAACAQLAVAGGAATQQRLTLAQAEAAALANGPRLRLAAADAALAQAEVLGARAYPNPTATAEYTRSPPQYHLTAEQPLEFPWLRRARIQAALAGAAGARMRLEIERAALRFAVDSAYLRAAALHQLTRLSARTAAEGSELVRVARIRRDAGDASELDVELALVSQGGLQNAALADSLDEVSALLTLQTLLGLPAEHPTLLLADSLASLTLALPPPSGPPLATAAAQAELQARQATLAQERAARFGAPSLLAGVEWHDPTGSEPGYLPTLGVSLPVPLWDRNRGPIAAARAGVERAQAALRVAQLEAAAALAAAERERAAAVIRAERDQSLLSHAERVVAMTSRGYREGAFPLTAVLEAQRAAREALRQYVQDLAALRTAEATSILIRTVGTPP